MLAENPTYNKKIRLLIGLAPIVNTKHSSTPLLKLVTKDFRFYKVCITLTMCKDKCMSIT